MMLLRERSDDLLILSTTSSKLGKVYTYHHQRHCKYNLPLAHLQMTNHIEELTSSIQVLLWLFVISTC
jgi:hypothetical protein